MNNVYKLKTLTLATSLAIGLIAVNVMAAQTYDTDTYTDTSWQTPEAAEFSRLDTSGNGLVMPYEAMRGKAFNSKTFAKADADHDGSIDQREYIYYKTGAWPVAAPVNTTQTSPLQPAPSQPEAAVETEPQDNVAVGEKRSVGEVIDDSVITAKSKAAILRTENLKTLQISVETRQGEVTLSGVVDSEAAKMKAEEVVRAVGGVTSVKNNLEIKT